MRLQRYYEKVYGAPLYLALNMSQDVAKKLYAKEINPSVMEQKWGKAHAFAYSEDNNTVYGIWIEDTESLPYISHEVFHLAGFILTDRGVKYDPDNDEPFAYLIEHLVKVVIKKGTHVKRTKKN